jgi:hypothetical protein
MPSSYASEHPARVDRAPQMTGWIGLSAFAGVMLLLLGSLHGISGLLALFREDYYLVEPGRLAAEMSYTGWGWVHLLLGLVLAAAGIGIFFGMVWARIVGIAWAVLSALTNLTFMAAIPVWCAVMITLDVLVIYALSVHGRDVRPRRS